MAFVQVSATVSAWGKVRGGLQVPMNENWKWNTMEYQKFPQK